MFLLLAGPLGDSKVDGRLLGGNGELVDVLPPLGLEVFAFLFLSFLFFLELHLLHRQNKPRIITAQQTCLLCNQIHKLIILACNRVLPQKHNSGVIKKHLEFQVKRLMYKFHLLRFASVIANVIGQVSVMIPLPCTL